MSKVKTYTVPERFLAYLLTGDEGSLDDLDFQNLVKFYLKEGISEGRGYWSYDRDCQDSKPVFASENDVTPTPIGDTVVEAQWIEYHSLQEIE